MAQLGSALDWGSRGRGFKSRQPDNHLCCFSLVYVDLSQCCFIERPSCCATEQVSTCNLRMSQVEVTLPTHAYRHMPVSV